MHGKIRAVSSARAKTLKIANCVDRRQHAQVTSCLLWNGTCTAYMQNPTEVMCVIVYIYICIYIYISTYVIATVYPPCRPPPAPCTSPPDPPPAAPDPHRPPCPPAPPPLGTGSGARHRPMPGPGPGPGAGLGLALMYGLCVGSQTITM